MAIPTTRFGKLQSLLEGTLIRSANKTYHVCYIDEMCLVFSESDTTKKVMIPTDVVLEWISAYEFGLINTEMKSREMRQIISPKSEWAKFIHGFDTHLAAIIRAWSEIEK